MAHTITGVGLNASELLGFDQYNYMFTRHVTTLEMVSYYF